MESLDQQNEENFSNDQIIGETDANIEKGLVEEAFLNIINDPKNGFSENEKNRHEIDNRRV